MSTMNVSLPDAMKTFVDEQVAERGYGTSSEFVRELIRREQDRQKLRMLILAGVQSGRSAAADASYFASLRKRIENAPAPNGRTAVPAVPNRADAPSRSRRGYDLAPGMRTP